jgi:hypothetical protein
MIIHKLVRVLFAVLISLLALCQSGDVAGNSSQTGSGGVRVASVNGVVSGTTSSNACISLYVWDYVVKSDKAVFSDTVYADETGKFLFETVADAYYNLLVVDTDGKMGFIRNIPVFKTAVFDTSLEKIEKPGTLKGIAYDRSGKSFARALIRIKGAPFFTRADNDGTFTLDTLPSGPHIIQVVNDMVVSMVTVLEDSTEIKVVPDSVVVWDKKK